MQHTGFNKKQNIKKSKELFKVKSSGVMYNKEINYSWPNAANDEKSAIKTKKDILVEHKTDAGQTWRE